MRSLGAKSFDLTCATLLLLVAKQAAGIPRQSCDAPRYVRTSTVGAEDREYAEIVRTDGMGRIITGGLVGRYAFPPGYVMDFDPTEGVDEKVGFGGEDVFIMVTNADGSYAWTHTFGGDGDEDVRGVAIDAEGRMYVAGTFGREIGDAPNAVDFDPGPDEDIRVCAEDSVFGYLTQYGRNGEYLGTYTNGVEGGKFIIGDVAFDPFGNLFMKGRFDGEFDFDPGDGVDLRRGGNKAWFVTKWLSDGSYAWTIELKVSTIAVRFDPQGNLYLAGNFNSAWKYDFDPGPGKDRRGGDDVGDKAFVTRINADLSYGWTRMVARGDTGDVRVVDFEVDADGVYVAGSFSDYIEFDPDGSPDPRIDEGYAAWLVKINTQGDYQWVHAIPSDGGNSSAQGVSADGRGGVYFTGNFAGNTNFDPDGSGDWQFGRGNSSIFVSKLGVDRTYLWTRLMNGSGSTQPWAGVEAASDGRLLIAGYFNSSGVDFDPTEGEDIRHDNGAGDAFVSTWLCSDCDALLSHGLWAKPRGAIVSRVTTNLPAGRVKVQLTSDDGGITLSETARLRPDGRARTRFDGLSPGRYDVQIQWIEDENGARLCDGPLMERSAGAR
ncbi:MAG: hypothetical protein BroJett003_25610 [Planctomycetota bacterium]|nr:MAG: hypothetical protein BroJett003_25610 [Planctomycetota bacterium]